MTLKTIQLEADYLVIGAGASGMAFTDELIRHTTDISVIIVDRHSKPSGHWNDAYSFVTLHQPSTFYGVNSKHLQKGGKDLATLAEIKAYYEAIMKELEETGRVKFFPQCEYQGDGVFHSMVAKDLNYKVNVLKKTVDATYIVPIIPSTHKPNFEIANGVNFVPVNELSHLKSAWERYLVIGGGKTSCDAIVFLLNQSVDPDSITWVVPNGTWFFSQNSFYPDTWVESNMNAILCILNNTDHNYKTLFKELEKEDFFYRVDTTREPTRFKGATISYEDIKKLRLVKNVIRNRRIKRIDTNRILFVDDSEEATFESTLHVDCSANGSSMFIPTKIFNGRNVLVQDVKSTQTTCSAALIARFETLFPDEEEKKNQFLKPISRHQTPAGFFVGFLGEMFNEGVFTNVLGGNWVRECRLHPLYHVTQENYKKFIEYVTQNGEQLLETLKKVVENIDTERSE